MPVDPIVENFLGRWLSARMGDQPVATPAQDLFKSLSKLLQGDMSQRFQSGLASRISDLRALLERIDAEEDQPPPPDSTRGKWLKAARQLAARWDDAQWVIPALELTNDKNPLLLSAISQSLEEALEQGQVGPQVVRQVRRLRFHDERILPGVPLPPAPQAEWCPSAYVFPAAGRALMAKVKSATTELGKGLTELDQLISNGWPVARVRLENSLRELIALMPEGSGPGTVLRETLQGVAPDVAVPEPALAPAVLDETGPDTVLRRARISLDELARKLLAGPAPEAQAFGRRLKDLGNLPNAQTAQGLHYELVGCLSFLDEPGGPGAADRWRPSALDRLARIAQTLGGGEVLDDRLVGQPLSRWTEFVTFVGYDDDAAPSEARCITRVERTGYSMIFSDGSRKALVRAHVRLAL